MPGSAPATPPYKPVAQLAEQRIPNSQAVGSSPTWFANLPLSQLDREFGFYPKG